MLQEIKIKNFKSFKEEAELSFEAYSDDTNQLSWINSVKNLFRNYKMKAYTYILPKFLLRIKKQLLS